MQDTTVSIITEESRWLDALPQDMDLNGQTVTIHVRGDNDTVLEVYTEEANGEVLNDAVYIIRNMIHAKNDDVASYVAKHEKSIRDAVENTVRQLESMQN